MDSKRDPLDQPGDEVGGAVRPAMASLDEAALAVPAVRAGILLLARALCHSLQLAHSDVASILEATGASRASAYAYRKDIVRALGACQRRPGRPRKRTSGQASGTDATAHAQQIERLRRGCLDYVMGHPGAVAGSERRRWYSPGFREHVLALCADGTLSAPEVAGALGIPLGTVRRWLARDAWCARPAAVVAGAAALPMSPAAVDQPRSALHARIVREWLRWRGPFTRFCTHLREHGRVSLGRTAIAGILARYKARPIRRRRGVHQAAVWRDSFERFFPGAQWVGDGARLTVWVDDQEFVFNLQLWVDADTGALVGMSIRDQEDSQAVIRAFTDGVATTGSAPLAVLLDNHASNHSGDVACALDATMLMFSTPGRPQHKAHVEGAFGLFARTVPTMRVSARVRVRDRYRLARQILELVVTTWARTLNHRPRNGACRCSRVRAYQMPGVDSATVHAAYRALRARADGISRRSRRRTGRAEVAVEEHPLGGFVRDALVRLGLSRRDNWHDLGARVLRFAHGVVLDGLAIYAARQDAGSLPIEASSDRCAGAGARYLLGILIRLQRAWEGSALASRAVAFRRAANAFWRAALGERLARTQATCPEPEVRVKRLLDQAMAARAGAEREFWLDATVAAMSVNEMTCELSDRALRLYRGAARHVMNAHDVRHDQRFTMIRDMAARLVPLRCES